jgi:hypothetical protein
MGFSSEGLIVMLAEALRRTGAPHPGREAASRLPSAVQSRMFLVC